MTPKLEKAFKLRGYLDKENSINTGAVKNGPHHIIIPISKGMIEGQGIKAKILPGSHDCLLLDQVNHTAHLDVRLQAVTTNRKALHIYWRGLLKVDSKARKIIEFAPDAETTHFGDHYWFTAPTVETDDENLKWLEDSFFISEGRFVVDENGYAIEYQIYRVTTE